VITPLEMMSLIVAGAFHDFEHPGFNNVYLVENRHPIALKYNGKPTLTSLRIIDVSVLENYHIA
jgi:cAMP-specific phosphodiesterase 4